MMEIFFGWIGCIFQGRVSHQGSPWHVQRLEGE